LVDGIFSCSRLLVTNARHLIHEFAKHLGFTIRDTQHLAHELLAQLRLAAHPTEHLLRNPAHGTNATLSTQVLGKLLLHIKERCLISTSESLSAQLLQAANSDAAAHELL
jgi:hypothetical protein